jgi:hypothetical protein
MLMVRGNDCTVCFEVSDSSATFNCMLSCWPFKHISALRMGLHGFKTAPGWWHFASSSSKIGAQCTARSLNESSPVACDEDLEGVGTVSGLRSEEETAPPELLLDRSTLSWPPRRSNFNCKSALSKREQVTISIKL